MVYFSDDSSDSDEKSFDNKKEKQSPVINNREKSESDLSTTHGIVVTNKSPAKKSPTKQSRKKLDDSDDELKLPIKQHAQQYEDRNTSDEEQVPKSKTPNIKIEPYSSDAESETELSKSVNTVWAEENLFDYEKPRTNKPDIEEAEDSSSEEINKNSATRHKTFIKQEVISSDEEDESTITGKDSSNFITESVISEEENLSASKRGGKESSGNCSDSEIPPSQFWLHQYKEVKKKDDEKVLPKGGKKSSPIKNLESDEKERRAAKAEVIVKKELSQRKSPPRITKTEIISTKFKRIDQRIKKARKSYIDEDNFCTSWGQEEEGFIGSRDSGDDNESDEEMMMKIEKNQSRKSSPKKSDLGEKIPKKEPSPEKKRQSPQKKAQTSPKKKLSSSPERKTVNTESTIKGKRNALEKTSPKRNLESEFNEEPFKTRPNICDNDSSNEEDEEKCIVKGKRPENYVLALEKPKNSNNRTSNPNGKQLRLIVKNKNQIVDNDESNSSVKSKSSPRKASIVHPDEKHPSEDSSGNVISGPKINKKLCLKKERHDSDCSDEAETSVKKVPKNQKQHIIKHSSTERVKVPSKRKLEKDDSSSDEETSPARDIAKTPLRKKDSESNSSELKSKKRAEGASFLKKPEHTMSDSDDTDSLTKLNTTLNKSMAFMENQPETVKLNKSRKSVSINTKQNLLYTPNDAKNQKSILKKAKQVATNDNSEGSSDSQEQSIEQNVQENDPTVNGEPKTIKRPLNLQNFKDQETLAYDLTKPSFGLDDLSDDDEIYILDIPRTVDPRELKGQTIKLGGKSKLKIGDQLYETCSKDVTNVSCVFNTDSEQSSYKTVNLRPAGYINLRQKLPKSLHIEFTTLEKKNVPFPEKLKIRHPLLGAEYEDKIIIAEKEVSRQIPRSIKREKSRAKNNEIIKVEKKAIKLKSPVKHKDPKVESNKNNSKNNIGNGSDSSDSDSDGGFFQKVKRESTGNHEKRKKSRSLSSILNLNKIASTKDLSLNSDEKIIGDKVKESSVNKKLGLSLNSSTMKNDSFISSTKYNKFFSSTPIKVENDDKIAETEISTNKVRKRKTQDDENPKGIKSPKKVKKPNWSISSFENKIKKVKT